jgi:hypothetical protein
MRRWRKLRWAVIGAFGALVLLRAWQVYWPEILTVSYPDYCRVQVGMNSAEVAAIFRGPPMERFGSSVESLRWEGCAGSASVGFDQRGQVVAKQYLPRADWDNADAAEKQQIRSEWRQIVSQRRRAGPLDDLIRALRREWHRWFP